MTESEHAMLVGAGADAFAREHGMPACVPEKLITARELERWRSVRTPGKPHDWKPSVSGTVGAVALDANGDLAAATSTGGTFRKFPGRVGDSSLVGCGTYADNRTGAVSATGMGEALMKIVTSKTVCDFVAGGMTAQEAADATIALLAERTAGRGGIIVLDRAGRVGVAHNAPYIAYACVTDAGEIVTGINGPCTSPPAE
jgi:beta-aspartyl-peptidase (threonine type)